MSVSESDPTMVEEIRKQTASYVAAMTRIGTPLTFADALRGHRAACQENLRDEGEYGASVWRERLAAIDTLAWQEGISL